MTSSSYFCHLFFFHSFNFQLVFCACYLQFFFLLFSFPNHVILTSLDPVTSKRLLDLFVVFNSCLFTSAFTASVKKQKFLSLSWKLQKYFIQISLFIICNFKIFDL